MFYEPLVLFGHIFLDRIESDSQLKNSERFADSEFVFYLSRYRRVFLFAYLRTGEIASKSIFNQHPAGPTAFDLFAKLDLHPNRTVVEPADVAGIVVPVGIQYRGGKDLTTGRGAHEQPAFICDSDDFVGVGTGRRSGWCGWCLCRSRYAHT